MNNWVARILIAITGVAVIGTPAAAEATTANLISNPSFEQQWNGRPVCWAFTKDLSSTANLTLTSQSHTGSRAARVEDPAHSSGRLFLSLSRGAPCPAAATPGRSYAISIWYRSSGVVNLDTSVRLGNGWTDWSTAAQLPPSDAWAAARVVLGPVPQGTTVLSFGLSVAGSDWLVADDASVTDTTPSTTPLFQPRIPATDGLVTNEYAYWNPTLGDARISPDWEMTSGSLFSKDGGGYSGAIDAGRVDPLSAINTNSAIFRLTTKRYDFGDVRVGFGANVKEISSTLITPPEAWDGIHIFLRYQNEASLYYASVARRDGSVVIKKKCPGGPSNGGTYYPLAKETTGFPIKIENWWNPSASIRTNNDGSVTIVAYEDGVPVATATDSGMGCAAITRPGAVGIRGDNVRFQFTNFTVSLP